MRILSILLIIAGLAGLIAGGFSYTDREQVLKIGSLEATVEEKKKIPIPPIAGGAALVIGVLLLLTTKKSRSALA